MCVHLKYKNILIQFLFLSFVNAVLYVSVTHRFLFHFVMIPLVWGDWGRGKRKQRWDVFTFWNAWKNVLEDGKGQQHRPCMTPGWQAGGQGCCSETSWQSGQNSQHLRQDNPKYQYRLGQPFVRGVFWTAEQSWWPWGPLQTGRC